MQVGYITARVYTSEAEIPVSNAIFSVMGESETDKLLYGSRVTDENGKTTLIPVESPDRELSLVPGNAKPFTTVNVRVDHPDFVSVYVTGVQIFAGQISVQEVALLPLSFNNSYSNSMEYYDITSQNL